MCGRYTLSTPAEVLSEVFEVPSVPELAPRYNIAPTQEVAAVRRPEPEGPRSFALLRWGLVPGWAKDPAIGNRMINARAESVAEKPAFRGSFKDRRCLVLADGYYEWMKVGKGPKQPYHIRLAGGGPFAIAGLWARWSRGEGDPIESCTLITTDAPGRIAEIHHRMPVILKPADFDLWLDPKVSDRDRLEALLRPYPEAELDPYPVSTYVNSPANQGSACIRPLE